MSLQATILFREAYCDALRAVINEVIDTLSAERQEQSFWIGKPDRPYATRIEIVSCDKRRNKMSPGEAIGFEKHFGHPSGSSVALNTESETEEAHRALGQAVLALSEATGGIICFCGALQPCLRRTRKNQTRKNPARSWMKQDRETDRFLNEMPGTICTIPYEIGPQSLGIAHYADQIFMGAWVDHPFFHMVAINPDAS